jgi:hypothetical protein
MPGLGPVQLKHMQQVLSNRAGHSRSSGRLRPLGDAGLIAQRRRQEEKIRQPKWWLGSFMGVFEGNCKAMLSESVVVICFDTGGKKCSEFHLLPKSWLA